MMFGNAYALPYKLEVGERRSLASYYCTL